MPETATMEVRLTTVERYQQNHGTTLAEHNNELARVKTDRAVQIERDKHMDERLDRIEKSIAGIHKLGWWVLATFGAAFIALVANFLFKGGFVA